MLVKLESDELATVLAALRFYQSRGLGDPAHRPYEIHQIATNEGQEISLDAEAIDSLCERINIDDCHDARRNSPT